MRRPLAIGGLALACVALSACAPIGFACSAVGYTSVAEISLSDPQPGLELWLCDGEDCAPGPPMVPVEMQPVATTPTAAPADTGVMSITGDSASGWRADFLGGQPVVGYQLRDAAGTVIAAGSAEVEWARVGGSERCGGPREAQIEIML